MYIYKRKCTYVKNEAIEIYEDSSKHIYQKAWNSRRRIYQF
jgi:hypothetical protein